MPRETIESLAPRRVLLVDHDETERATAEHALFTGGHGRGEQAGYYVETAGTLLGTLLRLGGGDFDAVLLELSLPDSEGIETLRRLRAEFPTVPVVVLTRLDDAELGVEAVKEGAQDFLVKSRIHPHVLVRVVRYACERHRVQSAQLGFIDSLTQLYSLRGFIAVADQVVRLARRNSRGLVLLVVRAESLASMAGTLAAPDRDELLLRAAALLRTTFRASDVIGRIGNDRFGVVAVDASDATVPRIIERLDEAMRDANAQAGGSVGVLGVGAAPLAATDTVSVDELIARAGRSTRRE